MMACKVGERNRGKFKGSPKIINLEGTMSIMSVHPASDMFSLKYKVEGGENQHPPSTMKFIEKNHSVVEIHPALLRYLSLDTVVEPCH